jgi:threonine 3-dehydrogenase
VGKMRALVKSHAAPGIWMEDVPAPEPGIYDVLIRVHRTSICGTDIHILNWDAWAQKHVKPPVIIGHEFSGKVAAIGSKVDAVFKVGDIVSGEGHVVCGQCRNCLAGRRHLCARPRPIGVDRSGAFAEYLVLPATNVWYADSPISLDLMSCFPESSTWPPVNRSA